MEQVGASTDETGRAAIEDVRGSIIGLVVTLLGTGCSESLFEGGRYAFDGAPAVHRNDISSITVEPIPEGPSGPVFVTNPESVEFVREELDLAELLLFVPDPLPATLDQGDCEFGGDVVVTTDGGITIAYGPCRRPPSIEELRAQMVVISNRACGPDCSS